MTSVSTLLNTAAHKKLDAKLNFLGCFETRQDSLAAQSAGYG
jgi:hypothetical protein